MDRKRKILISVLLIILVLVFSGFAIYLAYFQKNNTLNTDTNAANGATINLTINPAVRVNPFTKNNIGVAFDHYTRETVTSNPMVLNAFRQINPGVIRYANGEGANELGWRRQNNSDGFSSGGNNYSWSFSTGEIDRLATFARNINSDVMMPVNIADNDPAMWADLVRYTNVDHNYGFKYWEFGNELDFDSNEGVNAQTYAQRAVEYQRALLAVDPTITVITGVPAYPAGNAPNYWDDSNTSLSQYLTLTSQALRSAGLTPQSQSYHWYQNAKDIEGLARYTWDGLATNSWRNGYARRQADIMSNRVRQESLNGHGTVGITELNVDAEYYNSAANTNHLGAVWAGDVIGRLAYSGTDYATWFTGYTPGPGNYGMVHDNFIASSYSVFYMYSHFFDPQMVQSSTSSINELTVWAATDPANPSQMTLMINNLTGESIPAAINTGSFNAQSAQIYELLPDQSITGTSVDQNIYSRLNGVSLTPSGLSQQLGSITPQTMQLGGTSTFNRSFPPYSVTSMILSTSQVSTTPSNGATPSATITTTTSPVATATTTPSNTASPSNTVTPTSTRTVTSTPQASTTTTVTTTTTSSPAASSTSTPTTSNTATPTTTHTATSTSTPSSGATYTHTSTPTGTLPNTGKYDVYAVVFAFGGVSLITAGILGFSVARRRRT